MSRLLLACAILAVSFAAQAQTTTKPSPGEMAAQDAVKAEKRAACIKQSKERKLGFMARRKFVNECIKH